MKKIAETCIHLGKKRLFGSFLPKWFVIGIHAQDVEIVPAKIAFW